MICPRCGTEMLTDCSVCHYEHKILLDEQIRAKLKASWVRSFRAAWDTNMMVYDRAKFFLLVFSIVCLGVVLSFMYPRAFFIVAAVNLWVMGMATYEFMGARKKRDNR